MIGRILFALLLLPAGLRHVTKSDTIAGFAEMKGLPFPRVAVFGSGVWLLSGGLSVLLGIWADLGSLLLAVFFGAAALTMHNFWTQSDPHARQNDRIHFNKNIELTGASLMLFAFFAHTTGLALTLTRPLFSLG